ncbi:MAG TPA: nuclear transport factor 2 family protein [Pyrinomonadaceae bacterium]|nr:nuclear transport factor 2 family protein [Pyrinomonadaceae bacterium]
MQIPTRRLDLRIAVAIALGCAALIALGLAYKVTTLAYTDDEASVREALIKSALSFEKNDLAMASQVWANDESLTVFESGHANYGWADYRDHHLVPEMGEMKNTKYGFTDIRVHLAGKTAWATLKYTISADVPDNGKMRHVDGGGLGTAVLEERNGRWRIVHWHSSAPRRAAAAPSPTPRNS